MTIIGHPHRLLLAAPVPLEGQTSAAGDSGAGNAAESGRGRGGPPRPGPAVWGRGRVGGSLPPPCPAALAGRRLRLYPPEAMQWQRQRMVSVPHIHGRLAGLRIDADYPAVGHCRLRASMHLMAPHRTGSAR